MPSEISQKEKDIILSHFKCRIFKKKTHRNTEQISDCQRHSVGMGKMGEGGQNVQTSSYKINQFWYGMSTMVTNNIVLYI